MSNSSRAVKIVGFHLEPQRVPFRHHGGGSLDGQQLPSVITPSGRFNYEVPELAGRRIDQHAIDAAE
jgi:hypothetical protein